MKEKLAYLAGIIDADGCIHIERFLDKRRNKSTYRYVLRLQIGVTKRMLVDWVQENFGGSTKIYRIKGRTENRNDVYNWRISSGKAAEVLETILPYLILKQKQALTAIDFRKTLMSKTESRAHKCADVRQQKNQLKEKLYNKMKKLNKRGVQNGL
jgi:hypothetical protein